MNKSVFMLGELVGSLERRAWIFAGVAVVMLSIFAGSIGLATVVTQPDELDVGATLIVTPAFSEQSGADNLIFDLRDDIAVLSARPGDVDAVGQQLIEVVLRAGMPAADVLSRFSERSDIAHVALPAEAPAGLIKTALETPGNLVFLLIGIAAVFALTLFIIFLGLQSARESFAGDIKLLEQIGISSSVLRVPFALYGGILGLISAIITGFFVYSMKIWVPLLPFLAESWVPELMRAGMIEQIAVRSVLIVFLVGLVFCLTMGLAIYRYPRPFNLSRSSSSSSAVSAR